MSSFKPTKEFMLTPRECRHCGQHMSAELLAKKRFKRAERISEALKKYAERKSVEQSDTTIEQKLPRPNCENSFTSVE